MWDCLIHRWFSVKSTFWISFLSLNHLFFPSVNLEIHLSPLTCILNLHRYFLPPHVRHIKRMTCAHLYIWKLNGAHSSKKKRRAESLLCSNRDLQWTPQSPHSAVDSQHSCLLQCWETHSSHISLSPSLSPSHSLSPLSFSSSHHPPQPGRHCGPVCALFDVVLEVNRRRKHLTQLLNRERLNVS